MNETIKSLGLFLLKFKGISFNKIRKTFQIGIMIDHPKCINSVHYAVIESHIVGGCINKDDVLFIDSTSGVNLEYYKSNGYNYTQVVHDKQKISINLIIRLVKKLITNHKVSWEWMLWNLFCDEYKIKNYVKKTIPDNVEKTNILRQNNIKTWYLFPDCISPTVYYEDGILEECFNYYSGFCCDVLVCSGDNVEKFFRSLNMYIGEYVQVGCLFSQIVNEIKNRNKKV